MFMPRLNVMMMMKTGALRSVCRPASKHIKTQKEKLTPLFTALLRLLLSSCFPSPFPSSFHRPFHCFPRFLISVIFLLFVFLHIFLIFWELGSLEIVEDSQSHNEVTVARH